MKTWATILFISLGFPMTALAADPKPIRIDMHAVNALIESRHDDRGEEVPDDIDRGAIKKKLQDLRKNLDLEQEEEFVSYFSYLLGYKLERKDIRKQVQDFSHRNLHALIGDRQVALPIELENRLAERLATFRHNQVDTALVNKVPPMWISSTQLEKMDLPLGAQSDDSFNTEFLNTANWFFFYVGKDKDAFGTERAIFLDGDYARKAGMVFPFIMYVDDLVRFGCSVDAKKCRELYDLVMQHDFKLVKQWTRTHRSVLELLEAVFGDLTSGHYDIDIFEGPYGAILRHFRALQAQYFFTVDDYAKLVRVAVSDYLKKIPFYKRESDLNLEALVARALTAKHAPPRFEFRVAVGIPGQYTQLLDCNDELTRGWAARLTK